jgi:hypothetical protein
LFVPARGEPGEHGVQVFQRHRRIVQVVQAYPTLGQVAAGQRELLLDAVLDQDAEGQRAPGVGEAYHLPFQRRPGVRDALLRHGPVVVEHLVGVPRLGGKEHHGSSERQEQKENPCAFHLNTS